MQKIEENALKNEIVGVKKKIEAKKLSLEETTLYLKMLNDTIEPEVFQLKKRVAGLNFVKMTDEEFLDEHEKLKFLISILQDEMSKGAINEQ